MNAALTDKADRVRRHTRENTLENLDGQNRENIQTYGANRTTIEARLAKLDCEWDVERTLEANAATLALTGAALGTTGNKKWFWLTGGVLGFLFQHATTGWCPPLPVLRKLGVRTQGEIDQEKYALKAIRGDFSPSNSRQVDAAVGAVSTSAATGSKRREPDRVRRYTSQAQQHRLDEAMERRVRLYASQPAAVISERIRELRCEWSIERYLQINVAAVGLTTAALAVGKNRKWGYATCAGLAFFVC